MQPEYVWEDAAKSELFAETLERQFRPFESGDFGDQSTVARLRDYLTATPSTSARRVTGRELREALRQLNTRKACGPDGITAAQLRALGADGVEFLRELLNACLALGYYPRAWKIATVSMIPKPNKDQLLASGYRPISLLSLLAKAFERLILERLQQEIRRLKLLRDEQFGFRIGLSSAQQLTRLSTEIGLSLERRQNLPVVFLDMRSAFDSVWHEGALACLADIGISDCYVRLIASFLTDRRFKVRVNGVHSSPRRAAAGVPQGSVLSPTLFGLYVNDAPLPVEKNTGIQHCGLLMFADDFAYYAKSADKRKSVRYLNDCLAELPKWLSHKKLALNPDKCVAVNFTRQRADPDEVVSLLGTHLPWQKTAKYLGVKLDSGLRWHAHAKYVSQKITARTTLLRPLLRAPELHPALKRRLFTACVRSIWTYACEVFAAAPPSTLRPIRTAENRAARLAAYPHLPPPIPNRYPRNTDVFGVLGIKNQFLPELQRRSVTALRRALGPKAPRILRDTGREANSDAHRSHLRKGPKRVAFSFRALPHDTLAALCEQAEATEREGEDSPSAEGRAGNATPRPTCHASQWARAPRTL